MRWKTVALVLVVFITCLHSALAEQRAIKATTPVEVSIYPATPVSRGAASTFKVVATSSVPSEDFVIEIIPSVGSQVLSGNLLWSGPVMPGVPRELSVTLRMANDTVPTVSVTSGIQIGNEVRFAASATYTQEPQTPAAYQTNSRERIVFRKGRQVIEYQVK